MPTDIGSFADVAASGMPADDAVKGPQIDVQEPPVKETAVAKEAPVKEAPVKEATEKVEEKKDEKPVLTNPNLSAEEKTEKAVDAADEDKLPEALGKGMTAAAKAKAEETWKTIKTAEKAAIKERDTIKSEIAELKKKLEESSKLSPELESLKKELTDTKQRLADYEGEISVTRVEATKHFKDTVTAPIKAMQADIEEIAKRYEIPSESLWKAITEKDPAKRADLLEEETADLKTTDKLEIVQAAKDYHRIQKAADGMRADASKQLEHIERTSKAEAEKRDAMTTQDYRAAVGDAWDNFQQSIPEIRSVEGQQAWNDHLANIRRSVEAVNVNELPVEEVARMKAAELLLPEVLAVTNHYKSNIAKKDAALKMEKERADKAEKALADYMRTAPGAGAGGATKEGGGKSGSGLFSDVVLGDAA
jgi:hypothetical protein